MTAKRHEDLILRDFIKGSACDINIAGEPTQITLNDIDKFIETLNTEPKKCACHRGFPAQYDVASSLNEIRDTMCIKCLQELINEI